MGSLTIKVRLASQPRGFLCLDELDLCGRSALEGLSLFDTNDNRATNGSKEREDRGGQFQEF
jgi:hypothetical protein